MGQRIGLALLGGPKWHWLAHFLLWSALVAGATIGALSFNRFGTGGLWIVALPGGLADHRGGPC
jgi:uncharacterized membrane protein YoaK (UPF0700 family)